MSAVLVAARQEAGLSQRDLAVRLNVPHTIVSRVELGERRLDVLEMLLWAQALGVPAVTLFKRIERRAGAVG